MFSCNLRVALHLDSETSLTKDMLAAYEAQPKKGDCAEKKALVLAKTFFHTEDAWLAKTGYLLDNSYKVDLVVKVITQKTYIGCQVKSSEHGAREHEALRHIKDWDEEFGFPECLVLGPGYKMVKRLSEILEADPNGRYADAVVLFNQLRGQKLPNKVPGLEDLVLLDLAVRTRSGLIAIR